jgi:solute carrier family 25 protein 16
MPSALFNNALPTSAILKDKPREMEDVRKKEFAVRPTDDNGVVPKARKPNKQSLDYVWRTGVAGGMAGCAVCFDRLDVATGC